MLLSTKFFGNATPRVVLVLALSATSLKSLGLAIWSVLAMQLVNRAIVATFFY